MHLGRERAALTAGFAIAIAMQDAEARADAGLEPTSGRIEGDVTVVVGAGVSIVPRSPRAEAELRLRYLEVSGLFATYEDSVLPASASEPRRLLALGLELRPLFLFRWLKGLELRRERLDLLLDSIGFELGTALQQPAGETFGSHPGVQLGLGVELPLAARASGPWLGLHGGLRWSGDALASGVVHGVDDRAAFLAITLAWHEVVSAHLVDAGDRAPP
jgi:hypothetical protein